jgi:hypothetical protein
MVEEVDMKERITFINDRDSAFDPKQLELKKNVLNIKALKAAREDRLTLALQELPADV